jgi:amino acid adenylation domain-containing protein/FkbM family methyltransferase
MVFKENSAILSIDAQQKIKEKEYWLNKLSGEPVKSAFPYDRKETAPVKHCPASVSFEFIGEIFAKLIKLSNQSDIRLHIILTAVLVGLLDKYTANKDIIVGAPIKKQEIEGEFINTVLILRNQLQEDFTFKDMLLDVSQTMAEANEHVNYPLETLLYQLNIPYSEKDFPLFDVALLLENIHEKKDIQHLNLNMIFAFSKQDDSITGEVEYNSSKYNKSTIERIVSHYKQFLATALANINMKPGDIDILGEAGKKQLLFDFNRTEADYPEDKTLHQLFEEQVEKRSDSTAVIGRTQEACSTEGGVGTRFIASGSRSQTIHVTYKELNQGSNHLAQFLRDKGMKPETVAALLMDRSVETIIGILGILKTGAGYLPIEPDYPEERINYMLVDSGTNILLTTPNLSKKFEKLSIVNCQLLIVNETFPGVLSENAGRTQGSPLAPPGHPHLHLSPAPVTSLAYIIYTSGTTGNPKGVMVEHREVVRLMFNDNFLFDFHHTDVWTMFHSYCFDFSVWEMYGALLYGGKLIVIPKITARDTGRYLEILKEERVTILNQTPSGFHNLKNEELKCREKGLHLKYIIFGGEALNPVILKEWRVKYPGTKLINMYGITETTVHVTYKEITDVEIETNSASIGKPIPTLCTYIMDRDQKLLPIGAPGEICVGGEGVARGYLNRPALTGEKFIKNPYKPTERLYRTGDLGRRRDDGEIEYAGRIDNQVKIRGHRIELGEVENRLLKFAPVKDAVVVAPETQNRERQLVAYVVPHPDHCAAVLGLLKLKRQRPRENHPDYDLPNGMTAFYLNRAETDFMYREIFEKYSYLKYGIILEEGACVFDVGANIGIFSLFVNSVCKNAKIFAFEPIPPIFEVLTLNTSIYDNESNIKLFQCGLSDSAGQADFTYYPNAAVLSGRFADETQEMKNVETFMRNQPSLKQEQVDLLEDQLDELLKNRLTTHHFNCQLKTLSQIIKENQVETIDLLKIDVEKSEIDILKGIKTEDWSKIRQIVIEVHNVDGRLELMKEILKNHGYKVEVEQDSELHNTDLYNIYARLPKQDRKKKHFSKGHINQTSHGTGTRGTWKSSRRLLEDIRGFLRKKLPAYMIPASFMLLEQLPLTPNGKINRKALPEYQVKSGARYVAPTDDIEKKIAGIWKEVLKLDRVGVNDSFFSVGGTSINIIQVNNRLREIFKRNIPVISMFEYPTIRSFSRYLNRGESGQTPGKDTGMPPRGTIRDLRRNKLRNRKKMVKGESNG